MMTHSLTFTRGLSQLGICCALLLSTPALQANPPALPEAEADPLTSPKITSIIQLLSAPDQPTIGDAKSCIEELETFAASLPNEDKAKVNLLIRQIKALFTGENSLSAAKDHANKKLPDLDKEVKDRQQILETTKKTPARAIDGSVDQKKWDYWIKAHSENLTKAIAARDKVLAPCKAAEQLVLRQLADTNSAIAGHLRAGRTEVVHALGSCFYAVQRRSQVALDFEPAVSYTWVAMRKMDPSKVLRARQLARKELIGWIAANRGAQAATTQGVEGIAAANGNENWFAELIQNAGVALAGVQAEKLTEKKMEHCLEIIFFTPEPNAKAPQILAALQSLITGKNPKDNVVTRFSKELIAAELSKVNPVLGANVEIVTELLGILNQ